MTTDNSSPSVEQLRNNIKLRGLNTESFSNKDTPLEEFVATLSAWEVGIQAARTAGQRDITLVKLQFNEGDIEVRRSNPPFTHPNAEIAIPYSETGVRADGQGSRWGFFAKSSELWVPDGQGLDYLIRHKLHMNWGNTILTSKGPVPIMVWSTQAKAAQQVAGWSIVGVDGQSVNGTVPAMSGAVTAAASSLDDKMAAAIDGKDQTAANQALMQIEEVRSTQMAAVMNGSVYERLEKAGKVRRDGNVFRKV